MSEAAKDTIYIDVDDEITGIIDKVRSSDKKIVALVLPKRATVLQSVVNMKLLKRSAQRSKKNLVLITSEAGLLPLAGAVGIHVAKNLQSKPEIPDGPPEDEIPESLVNEDELDTEDDKDKDLDKAKTVGELAGVAAVASTSDLAKDAEDIEVPEAIDPDDSPIATKGSKAEKSKKDKKDKKDKKAKGQKVPNFDRFKKWMILGGVAFVALLVFLYFAIAVWPKATIVIDTDSSKLNTTVAFTADTTSKNFDLSENIIPSQLAQTKKTSSQNANATGTKNIGTKATGTLAVTAQVCNSLAPPAALQAGTTATANSLNFITQSTATFTFNNISGSCINYKSTVAVTAVEGGTNYNLADGTNFTISSRSDITSAKGGTTGGTDNSVKVVSQSDIEGAKAQLANNTDPNAQATLTKQLEDAKMFVIKNSFTTGTPEVTTSVKAGEQADSVTVTSTITYSLLGVNEADLKKVIANSAKAQIDTSKQAILNDGLNSATYTVQDPTSPKPKVTVQTEVVVGPKIDTEALKKEIAGKKSAEIKTAIETRPGVKSVTVKFSPFWVNKTPSDVNKITIVFKQAADK